MKPHPLPDVGSEFSEADLGNAARTRRLKQVANLIAAQPAGGLPKQMLDSSGLEGAYRLFEKGNVEPQVVLDAHLDKTAARLSTRPEVLVLHDTTEFRFSGKTEREGLGHLAGESKCGFYAHYSIALSREGEPLGTLHTHAWNRPDKPAAVPQGQSRRRTSPHDPDRESLRWGDSAIACIQRAGSNTELIHVMDREGDCFELFALLQEYEQRFVIRLSHNRRLCGGRSAQEIKLFEHLSTAPVVFEREVVLTQRGEKKSKKAKKTFPARKRRNATLVVRAQRLEIFAANGAPGNIPASMTLNFVDIEELDTPDECEPVRWRLVTTEPIDTPEQIADIVDIYRKRWVIEEFFKAIKTGCNYEKRQLRTANALLIDLAIETAVAWRLLLMRWFSRAQSQESASRILTVSELGALRQLCSTDKNTFPQDPTIQEALGAVAQLGGHIKYHGPPGWLVLRRGFADLAIAERMWLRMNKIQN